MHLVAVQLVDWTYDSFSGCWSSQLIADGKVYVCDEDGQVTVFVHSSDWQTAAPNGHPLAQSSFEDAIYTTPIVANNVLYIASRKRLYAIANSDKALPSEQK